ncbi:hypothetical protein RF11_08115 [Thelohanellus kitauei]|uniref:Uncharacterized protein n=1 Tax=Thelohanellus kitauei TaxID=669202 RepID=A0A0C2MX00_THEKT|nr:hypothetical protein RF11_08115 [Thelohanellus kitauei]
MLSKNDLWHLLLRSVIFDKTQTLRRRNKQICNCKNYYFESTPQILFNVLGNFILFFQANAPIFLDIFFFSANDKLYGNQNYEIIKTIHYNLNSKKIAFG